MQQALIGCSNSAPGCRKPTGLLASNHQACIVDCSCVHGTAPDAHDDADSDSRISLICPGGWNMLIFNISGLGCILSVLEHKNMYEHAVAIMVKPLLQ